MDDRAGFGSAFEFLRLVWALDHALQRNSKRLTRTIGVSGPQRLVIRAVGLLEPVTGGDLARLLHLHASTLTVILRRLEEEGFLRRDRDARDGRRILIRSTAKGKRIESLTRGTIESTVARVLRGATPAEIAAARRLLASITEALSEEADAPPNRRGK